MLMLKLCRRETREKTNFTLIFIIMLSRTNKPVRMVLTRNIDMQITGHREGSMAKYKVGFDEKTGKIHSLQVTVYTNWGHPAGAQSGVSIRASEERYRHP